MDIGRKSEWLVGATRAYRSET